MLYEHAWKGDTDYTKKERTTCLAIINLTKPQHPDKPTVRLTRPVEGSRKGWTVEGSRRVQVWACGRKYKPCANQRRGVHPKHLSAIGWFSYLDFHTMMKFACRPIKVRWSKTLMSIVLNFEITNRTEYQITKVLNVHRNPHIYTFDKYTLGDGSSWTLKVNNLLLCQRCNHSRL